MLLLITFCVVFLIQSYFYLLLFRKYTSFQQAVIENKNYPISIVVCAKNEAANLKRLLPSLALQKYPFFEIVLVDDASTDSTMIEMLSFKKANVNSAFEVTIVQISERSSAGKKEALAKGIQMAQNEHILLIKRETIHS